MDNFFGNLFHPLWVNKENLLLNHTYPKGIWGKIQSLMLLTYLVTKLEGYSHNGRKRRFMKFFNFDRVRHLAKARLREFDFNCFDK